MEPGCEDMHHERDDHSKLKYHHIFAICDTLGPYPPPFDTPDAITTEISVAHSKHVHILTISD
jgi:hypothetical protein